MTFNEFIMAYHESIYRLAWGDLPKEQATWENGLLVASVIPVSIYLHNVILGVICALTTMKRIKPAFGYYLRKQGVWCFAAALTLYIAIPTSPRLLQAVCSFTIFAPMAVYFLYRLADSTKLPLYWVRVAYARKRSTLAEPQATKAAHTAPAAHRPARVEVTPGDIQRALAVTRRR